MSALMSDAIVELSKLPIPK